jgi:hypothetical protein
MEPGFVRSGCWPGGIRRKAAVDATGKTKRRASQWMEGVGSGGAEWGFLRRGVRVLLRTVKTRIVFVNGLGCNCIGFFRSFSNFFLLI